ncbi:putative leucine-rich repeat-containing, plant-type, leucine-rich repeat domain superfamily [Helianthus annuus]|nr:putative leucine-rich repeat-containing, plant-type, leucine-rich repeat domain superfamily [Helianthus annuus]
MNSNHKCPDEQRDALLLLKQNISSVKRLYVQDNSLYVCKDLNDRIRINWKKSIDCCDWIGITCNNFTGDVISLNLKCGMLQGVLEMDTLLSNLPKLEAVDISYSGLSIVTKNDAHYVNPDLYELSLAACNLTMIPDFLRDMKNLRVLDLSGNYISGHIPTWAGEIGGNNLIYLDLSDNFITGLSEFRSDGLQYLYLHLNLINGPLPPWICNKKHLKYLDISQNGITEMDAQCLQNISSSLVSLNVYGNMIQGPFPTTICSMGNLMYLDMSYNSFFGVIPECLKNISSSLVSLMVHSNMIQGPFPTTICNMRSLLYLDMSNNSFHGEIPQCFGNVISSLALIDLGANEFHGTIPKLNGSCEFLDVLKLNKNKLEGEVPSFLCNCRSLKILHLEHNQLNGKFPHWLGDLQQLQVLILRSNKLHGTIEASSTSDFVFPSLRIFDISNNRFVGRIPGKYFENFNAIKDMEKDPKTKFVNISGLHYYSIIPLKGSQFSYTSFYMTLLLLSIDLSSNRFEGEIPNIICNLKSLMVLNLSNNNLSGQIPYALGNLVAMEALDLSRNQLEGEIPQSVKNLNFLSSFNLSQNHLVGRIPVGTQLQSFAEDAFYGNPGLCGAPLTIQCIEAKKEEWIYMEPVMLGLGCGTLLGVVWGYRMLSTGRPKWFSAIADVGGHTRRKKRKQVHIRKRN